MFDPTGPWWEPGFADIARALGWRWIIIAGILIVFLGLLTLIILSPWLGINALAGEIKLLIFVGAFGALVVTNVIKKLVKERKDDFCIHCGYSMVNVPEHGRCPECGRGYHQLVVQEYRKDPHFFRVRYQALRRLPPRATAFAAGAFDNPDDGTC
ncbi:MAG: hypothetical protein HBSAPP03_12230 [Phycisphaerae bacterium]|nr:MAG: hypothetical protein HBSAPP03_12230 [Phycisphaerae bacterium]